MPTQGSQARLLHLHADTTAPRSPSPFPPSCVLAFAGREHKHQRSLHDPARSSFGKVRRRQTPQNTVAGIHGSIYKSPSLCFLCIKFGHVYLRVCLPKNRTSLWWGKKKKHVKLAVWFEIKPQTRWHKHLEIVRVLMGFFFMWNLSVPFPSAITPQLPFAERCPVSWLVLKTCTS